MSESDINAIFDEFYELPRSFYSCKDRVHRFLAMGEDGDQVKDISKVADDLAYFIGDILQKHVQVLVEDSWHITVREVDEAE